MKLGPATKLDRREKSASKHFDGDVMSANCDVIVICSNLWPAWSNPNSGLTFSLIVAFYITKTEKRTGRSLRQLSHYCFE